MNGAASPDYRFFAMLKLNWRRNLLLCLLIIIAFILQFGFINALGWGFFTPNILWLFPVFASLLEGPYKGMFWGFLMGLVWDIFVGKYIGLNILSWCAAGWFTGFLCAKLYKENYLVPVVALAITVISSQLIYLFCMGILGGYWPSFLAIAKNIFFAVIVNSAVAMVIYVPIYKSFTEGLLRKKLLSEAE